MLQFRDSLLLRPHPALWRVVLSFGVVYQLFLVFLLFQVQRDPFVNIDERLPPIASQSHHNLPRVFA